MSTYYYASLYTKQIASEYKEPYGQAILNSIRFETEMSGNIIAAASKQPHKFIERVYRDGKKFDDTGVMGFPYGLPHTELADGWIADIPALTAQILLDHPLLSPSDVIGVEAYITKGENLSVYDVAKYWWCYDGFFNGDPIGLMENDQLPNTVGGVHHEFPPIVQPLPPLPQITPDPDPANRIIKRTVPWDDGSGNPKSPQSNPWMTEIYTSATVEGRNDLGDPLYSSYWFSLARVYYDDVYVDDGNGSGAYEWLPVRVGGTDHHSTGFFNKPGANDLIYVFKWKIAGYPNEWVHGLYNVTSTLFPTSGLNSPATPQLDDVYPIIQLRNNKQWLDDYETTIKAKFVKRTFKKLNLGKLSNFIDTVDDSGSLNEISDVFFTHGVDLYSPKNMDNKYNYLFWKYVSDASGSALKKGNGDYDLNFFLIEQGEYNQYITFRDIDVTNHVPFNTMDKTLTYSHRWIIFSGAVGSKLAPWGEHYETADSGSGQFQILVPPADDAFSRKFRRIERLSMYGYIIEVKNAGGTVVSTIQINGIQQNHKIYFDATARSKWVENHANPADDTNVNAENQAILDEVAYAGAKGLSFVVPLIQPLFTNQSYFALKERPSIAARSLFVQMYSTDIQVVPWWQEVLTFVIEAFEVFNIFLTIITLGTSIALVASLEVMLQMIYKMGMEFLKDAIMKIVIKEVSKAIGGSNVMIIELLMSVYNGDFSDIGTFSIKALSQLGNIVMAVSEIAIVQEFERLAEDTDKLQAEMDKLDQQGKELDQITEDSKTTTRTDAVIYESPKQFLARTMDTQINDIVNASMVKYGHTPDVGSKYSFLEDLTKKDTPTSTEFFADVDLDTKKEI